MDMKSVHSGQKHLRYLLKNSKEQPPISGLLSQQYNLVVQLAQDNVVLKDIARKNWLNLTLGGRLPIHLLVFNRYMDTHSNITASQGGFIMERLKHYVPLMSLLIGN